MIFYQGFKKKISSIDYIGCFADVWNAFDISLAIFSYAGMTVEYCTGYCSRCSFTIAGLQWGYLTLTFSKKFKLI
jgi:hypothetical protein